MDKDTFISIWNALYEWSCTSKELYKLGVDSARYDKNLYNIIMKLLSTHYNSEQLNFMIFSIFDDVRELPLEDGAIAKIDTAEECWEYLNKLAENK